MAKKRKKRRRRSSSSTARVGAAWLRFSEVRRTWRSSILRRYSDNSDPILSTSITRSRTVRPRGPNSRQQMMRKQEEGAGKRRRRRRERERSRSSRRRVKRTRSGTNSKPNN